MLWSDLVSAYLSSLAGKETGILYTLVWDDIY